jgi:hypothetical protein
MAQGRLHFVLIAIFLLLGLAALAGAQTPDTHAEAAVHELEASLAALGRSRLNGRTSGHFLVAREAIAGARESVQRGLRLHAELGPSRKKATENTRGLTQLDGAVLGPHPNARAAYEHLLKARQELKQSPIDGHAYGCFAAAERSIRLAQASIERGVKLADQRKR